MSLDEILVLGLLKYLQQNSQIGNEQQKGVGSLIKRAESIIDICPSLTRKFNVERMSKSDMVIVWRRWVLAAS